MKLLIALPVLVVLLAMVLEGPAPAQASSEPDILGKLKEFGHTLEDKTREAIEHLKQKEIINKTRNWFSEAFGKVKEKLKTTFS